MPNAKPTPVVAVINMKGGVGKTIISANLFREMPELSKVRTLLVDLDAQANLTQLLLTRGEYEAFRTDGKTIYSIMDAPKPDSVFAISENDLANIENVDNYTIDLEPASASVPALRLLPGDFRIARLNLREATTLRLPSRRFHNFIEKARALYGLVVIDCNPSASFTTLCALEAATHLLIPFRADKFAMLGVEMLWDFIQTIPTITQKQTVSLILNDVNDAMDSGVESALRGHPIFGPMIMVSDIKRSTFFASKTDYTGFAVDRPVAHRRAIADLLRAAAEELSRKLGIRP